MTETKQPGRPALELFVVEGEGEKSHWSRIGAAWPHADGDGFNIQLSAIPLAGRLVARKPKQAGEKGGKA